MKISLYLIEQIQEFILPNQVAGSFTFSVEGTNLINVEERNGKWVLYSTDEVKVFQNNIIIDSVELLPGFYTLKFEEKAYLIYANQIKMPDMVCYKYDKSLKCIIGNNSSCTFNYNVVYLNDLVVGIGFNSDRLMLEKKGNTVIYLNKKTIFSNPVYINYGDELEIYGLRIIFLKDLMIVCNNSNLKINFAEAGVRNCEFPARNGLIDYEIKDVDLYNKNDYASKAPRIRRVIEPKSIGISPPPAMGKESEMPFILVVGPMFTMGFMSFSMMYNVIQRIAAGGSLKDNWFQILSSLAMLCSTLVWPLVTKKYTKKMNEKRKKEILTKYDAYLKEKEKEFIAETELQKAILIENLLSVKDCLNIIKTRDLNFWSKRSDQSDFMVVRIGNGNERLRVGVNLPAEGFTIEEDELKKKVNELVEKYKYILNVPIGYSLFEYYITAVMGPESKSFAFVNNIILQLVSFYSYEDLKIVVFTDSVKSDNWNYIRYLNHNFCNDKSFRFFANSSEGIKNVSDYLNIEASNRLNGAERKPYYLVIIDDYEKVKNYDFVEFVTESPENIGFSFLIIENRLSKLPSKCNNFINLSENESGVLKNSYERQEQEKFFDEIDYSINMMEIAKVLANIPVEFEDGYSSLPNSITFMEMENVGKVEQLNILNRWNSNDSTTSLKAEVGVDETGNLMYLDLHEKFHGPHGLIAGMTGSGKSEFIITYILSMCINYSPDDVAFILIDYKGGGLAGAFENKITGVYLPHLAGTITNLDKAEMDRTLVSIDSEVKKRQSLFNQARDFLGESTIDIYKYQKFYKEGKLDTPVPHLFIICDEFAELKSQQPDFMDNLISVARIGRSLGVHLILATQKPSGVVNDQIWSNTKFRVCLKVQDESDSREMLKRTEAAYLKQAGRFYLQVGYDEYFALGQSGWCGAKYYPSDKIVKEVDKSINFINDCGLFIKSIQASSGIRIKPQGEQLAAILDSIISVADGVGCHANRLWLENIPGIIYLDNVEKKYNFQASPYEFKTVIGEYDAPEKQEQGVVIYNFDNTIIYGNDGSEREMLIDAIIYGSVKNHTPDELNLYIVDYGSESFRKYSKLPHLGGIVFASEDEEFNNLFKMIKNEINDRKKLFADYGGEYKNYIKTQQVPLKVVIFNNYDSIYENNQDIYDTLPDLVRDSERYGVVFIITGNAINSIHNKIAQNFNNIYAFKLKDDSDYSSIFGSRTRIVPRDIVGRGVFKSDAIHEFQVASINENANDYILAFIDYLCKNYNSKAPMIPILPDFVRYENISNSIGGLRSLPIGLNKSNLDVVCYDFLENIGSIVTSNRLANVNTFIKSFVYLINSIQGIDLFVLDSIDYLGFSDISNYFIKDFSAVIDNLINYINQLIESKSNNNGIIIIYGLDKFLNKIDVNKFNNLVDLLKKYENFGLIVLDDSPKIKKRSFDPWFASAFNVNNGIWVGRGVSDQNLLHISNVNRDMSKNYENELGYCVVDGYATLVKFIDFISTGDENEK